MFKASEAREQNHYSVQAAQALCGIEMGILSLSAQGKHFIEVNGQYPVFVVNSIEQELTRAGYDVRITTSETFPVDVGDKNAGYCWARFEIEW